MGRTIHSFRIASMEEQEEEWKKFRQTLDNKSGRKVFDNIMFQLHICIIQLVLIMLLQTQLEYSQSLCLLYFITISNY
jgi:hypothetical protein